eukprot:SAG31_NODE_1118_length_9816_cov_41.561593_8_plen_1022_part_00
MSCNVKASLALIEAVNDMVESSQKNAAEEVQQAFDEILAALEEREGELRDRAKHITSNKLDELQAHVRMLEHLIEDAGTPAFEQKAAHSLPSVRETCALAVLEDPVVGQTQEQFDELFASFGTIEDIPCIPVSTLFDAAASQTEAKGFFARVLKTVSEMDLSANSAIANTDVEMLIALLDEIKREDVMEQACAAICNIASTSPELSRTFGEHGGIEMVLSWPESFLEHEKVVSASCFCIGVVSAIPSNSEKLVQLGAVQTLLDLSELEYPSVCENAMFGLCKMCENEEGKHSFLRAKGIERVTGVLAQYDKSTLQERAMQLFSTVGTTNADVRAQLMETGLVKTAVDGIKQYRYAPGLIFQCCKAFQTVIDTADETREAEMLAVEEMISYGAFTLMMECVGDFDTDGDLCSVVCSIFDKFGQLASQDQIEKSGLTFGAGIKNVIKCMEKHPRSLTANKSACAAINSLSASSSILKEQVLQTDAVLFMLTAIKKFERTVEFCIAACHTILTLAAENAHARTQVGSGGGVGIILNAILLNNDDILCLIGLRCIEAVVAEHKPNADIACHFGAISSVVGLAKTEAQDETISQVICSILISLLSGDIGNQVKFTKEGGENVVKGIAGGDDVLKILKPAKIKKRIDGTEPTFSFGLDVAAFFEDESNVIPELQAVKTENEVLQQEIIRFSAAGKNPEQIKKWRLICVDRNDITIYGGPKETDDNIFTKVIINYPIAKVMRVRIAPSFKSALIIESAYGEVGTVVTSSPKRAKEWRDILTALLPLKAGPEGIKQLESNGKKMKADRLLSWVGRQPERMLLLLHETNKERKIAQIIRLAEIESAEAVKNTLTIKSSSKMNSSNKFELPSTYEADLWESFIQQYLQERVEVVTKTEYERQRKLEMQHVAVTTSQSNPVPEIEPEPQPEPLPSDDEDDGVLPDEISEESIAKLERILAERKHRLEEEKLFEQEGSKELATHKKKARTTKARLARVKDDIKHEKMKRGGADEEDDAGANKSFAARMAMFNQ